MKYKKGDKVKVIFPPSHPAFSKIGNIIAFDKNAEESVLPYQLIMGDEKKYWFGETEIEVSK